MSGAKSESRSPLSLDQLIALNDEMAALIRAGVPLERCLVALGGDMPGRTGELAAVLGKRLEGGESLLQILSDDTGTFPRLWRAVVEAGLRSGNLSAALEDMAATGRRLVELRQTIGLALIYPLIVLLLAYGLFVFQIMHIAPILFQAHEELTSSPPLALLAVIRISEMPVLWAIPLPVILFALLFARWWYRTGHVSSAAQPTPSGGSRRFSLFKSSTVARIQRHGRIATFADVLGLMLSHEVALPDAVVLAADASGDRDLGKAARVAAQRLKNGELSTRQEDIPPQLPPLLGWLILSASQQALLPRTLRTIASSHRRRAAQAATFTAIYWPIVCTVVLGGGVVLLQGLAVLGPIWQFVYDLGRTY